MAVHLQSVHVDQINKNKFPHLPRTSTYSSFLFFLFLFHKLTFYFHFHFISIQKKHPHSRLSLNYTLRIPNQKMPPIAISKAAAASKPTTASQPPGTPAKSLAPFPDTSTPRSQRTGAMFTRNVSRSLIEGINFLTAPCSSWTFS